MPDYSKATASFPQAANRPRACGGNGFWQSVVILSFSAMAFSSFGYAACDMGRGVCEPSVDLARAKVEQLLNSAFLPPYSLSGLEKLDGRGFETQGQKK